MDVLPGRVQEALRKTSSSHLTKTPFQHGHHLTVPRGQHSCLGQPMASPTPGGQFDRAQNEPFCRHHRLHDHAPVGAQNGGTARFANVEAGSLTVTESCVLTYIGLF
jgi:hypothetical protein